MIDDLDSTLTQLLNDAPAGELPELRNADVSFVTPDRNYAPTQPTVNLFLDSVRENRELRDPTPIVERDGESYRRRPSPLRASCSYVVTAWGAPATGPARVVIEHRLLGQAVTWLSRFPTIPAQYLQGYLGQPERIYPPPTMVAQPVPDQRAGDFWTAMGVSPRPTFALGVTVELALGEGATGGLVLTTITEYPGDAPWIAIGGYVVEPPPGGGITDAIVDIVDLGLRTRSREEGRFTFPRVPPGPHTLRAVAQGFHPTTQPLAVPGPPEEHVVSLTPI